MRALLRFPLQPSFGDSASGRAGGILCVAALLCSAAPRAEAGALTSMSQYENSKALSANPIYRWSAAVKRTDSSGTNYASAVLIAPDLYITAGHVTPRNGSLTARINEIVFGTNYNTSTERYSVERTERFPGYVFGNASTIDLGVGWTTEFVSGFNSRLVFASAVSGTILTVAEYGNYGDSTTGELESIGDRLGGRAPIYNTNTSEYPSNRYFFAAFDGPSSSDPLNINCLSGASGSPWWSDDGRIVGISIASDENFIFGSTAVLRFNTEVMDYLEPLIDDSWARYNASISPRPVLTCSVTSSTAQLTFTGLIPTHEYRVMSSSTLGAWEEAHRFTATSAAGSWGETLTPEGRRFYRLEWTE
jgi:hypothetical protein